MSRAAWAAEQSVPWNNKQFSRWPAPAIGNYAAPIRSWHAPDTPEPRMTRQRQIAERAWKRITRGMAR